VQILYQAKPFRFCTYTLHKNRSLTDSLESYQNGVEKEVLIQRWNGRLPTIAVVWHLLRVLTAKEIIELRKNVFCYLKKHGIVATVSIELTKGANGKPNNKVHFHFFVDDQRSKDDIRELFNMACEHQGLVRGEDFRIDCYSRAYDDWCFHYYAKYGKKYVDDIILFKKGTGIRKFYEIGKWFKKDRGKGKIWEEIKAFMREKGKGDPDTDDDDVYRFDEEVPIVHGSYSDLDRVALREEYGIDLDKYADESVSTMGFCISGIGLFHKFTGGQWGCFANGEEIEPMDVRMMVNLIAALPILTELPEEHEQTLDEVDVERIQSDWIQCPPFYYHQPKIKDIRDRRYDWQRFAHSIAILE